MKKPFWIALVLSVFIGLGPAWGAENFRFEVYYQVIHGVEFPPFPDQPAGKLKEIFGPEHKEEIFYQRGLRNSAGLRKDSPQGQGSDPGSPSPGYVPADPKIGAGTMTVKDYSGTTADSKPVEKYRYLVTRVKVKDEKHLLELMGAGKDPRRLSGGQKGLLTAYRETRNQGILDMMKQGHQEKVNLLLVDTNGLESRYSKEISADFWPHAWLNRITIGSYRFNSANSENEARATFWHETAHTVDRTFIDTSAYGPDNKHNFNERTSRSAAFVEGWGAYRGFLADPSSFDRYRSTLASIRYEIPDRGKSTFHVDERSAGKVSWQDLLAVEGVNAVILYRLSLAIPGGQGKILKSFFSTNRLKRDLGDLLKDCVARNPMDGATIAKILDEETRKKMSNADLAAMLGNTPEVRDFLKNRRGKFPGEIPPMETIQPPYSLSAGGTRKEPVSGIQNPGSNPFED